MVHRAHVRPAHRENRLHRLIPADRESVIRYALGGQAG
jgi:hypothetical protein